MPAGRPMIRLFPALLFLSVACHGQESAPYAVREKPDLIFAKPGGVELLLDLHLPVGVENPPLVMFIHGGGWTSGDRKRCDLKWVAQSGYAVASIEYRMSQEARFPAQIHDCKGALRWLRAHQKELGYDASRVVVAGMSAGGHLAALMGSSGGVTELEGTTAGYPDESSAVQGVIDYFGPADFILRAKNQPRNTDQPKGSVYKLLGGPVGANAELARLASPVSHIGPGDPPDPDHPWGLRPRGAAGAVAATLQIVAGGGTRGRAACRTRQRPWLAPPNAARTGSGLQVSRKASRKEVGARIEWHCCPARSHLDVPAGGIDMPLQVGKAGCRFMHLHFRRSIPRFGPRTSVTN